MKLSNPVLLGFSMVLALAAPSPSFGAEEPASLEQFFATYCTDCHGPDKQKGDVRLDDVAAFDADRWLAIFEQLSDGEMPPDDEAQPSEAVRRKLIHFALAEVTKDAPPASTGYRRLNKREYGNTVRDLLGRSFYGYFHPISYMIREHDAYYLIAIDLVTLRAELLSFDSQLENAADPYVLIRDVYLQNRLFKIYDGDPPAPDYDALLEDF